MLAAGYGGMIWWPNVSKKLLTDTPQRLDRFGYRYIARGLTIG